MTSLRKDSGGRKRAHSRGASNDEYWDEPTKGGQGDSFPQIKTEWVQQASMPPPANQGGVVMYKKNGIMPSVMQSNIVHVNERLARTYQSGGEEQVTLAAL